MNVEELRKWFQKRPVWLQEAAKHMIRNGKLQDKDHQGLYEYCLGEVKKQFEKTDINIPINQLLSQMESDDTIKLKSIGNIKGINALSPRSPLNFGNKNLSIIYGFNGSGKSGYVRILKQICGVKTKSRLLSNIYSPSESEQKCTIEYQKKNQLEIKEWNVFENPIDDLIYVDVFDSECAMSYIKDENEVTYEPKILSFFSNLVNVCENISSKIESTINNKPSKKPNCPSEYNTTEGGKWYNEKLSADTTEECLNNYCSWTEDNQKELFELQKRLNQKDPEKEAKEIRKKNKYFEKLVNDTINFLKNLSDQKCMEINELKEKYIQAQKTAKLVADQAFEKAPLKGVGSETWKQLWQYAKEYSEKEAYKEQPFPVMSNDALCVLCQQKLDKDAKSRFGSFKNFVKGEAQRAVEDAKTSLESIGQSLPVLPKQEELKTKLDATGIQSDNTPLTNLYIELEKRKNQLISSDIQPNFIPLPSFEKWENEAKKVITDNEKKAKQYDEDATKNNRGSLIVKQRELQAREWLAQQSNPIKEEIERLKYIKVLNSARKLTDTTVLSRKKSELSTELITEDFVNRFNAELRELKADKVKVEIFKSRIEKGKALHKVRLKSASLQSVKAVDVKSASLQSVKAVDVLSEGELRIVALSAFLADVTGGKHSAPFVFDDPISSLDQNFEEAVAQRLVKLSKERQVIVFTHRLSMLNLLEECAKQNNIELDSLYVTEEHWGIGEPGDIPLFIKKPDKALKDLINRLPEAKTLLENQGKGTYEEFAKSLCSNFRIVIENVIEFILLLDVVKRHRRRIYSQNIKGLAKINNDDCNFLDDLMTRYSKPLHSLTDETPINIPTPEQLAADFELLKNWIKEFRKREVTVENK